jgi:hypothetical protein
MVVGVCGEGELFTSQQMGSRKKTGRDQGQDLPPVPTSSS